ncbi:MAG: pyruvate, water dikinase regulatory protein [bacterium]
MKYMAIFAVSDGTAATARLVIQAALAQFPGVSVEVKTASHINTGERVHQVVQEAAQNQGLIVYTLVSPDLQDVLIQEAREVNVPAIGLLEPLLYRLEEFLKVRPKGIPGIFKPFLHDYDPRIEAINFTVDHDDGQNLSSLDQADIVILGVSRTSKTPLSIYLSSRGWKVANVPVVPGVELPETIYRVDRKRIIALSIKVEQLATIRANRMKKFDLGVNNAYSDFLAVQKELAYAESLFQAAAWPIIDVTNKSIEEIAHEVISTLTQQGLKAG